MNRKDVWLWALYDFANSIAFVGVMFYFGLWFIAEKGGSDVWMSLAVAFSTVLLLLTLPVLGHYSDRTKRRMPFLSALSILCILSLLGFAMLMNGIETLTPLTALAVIALYSCFQYFYQASFAFYDAYLRDLSGTGFSTEKVSGIGMAMGQVGNLAGLALLMPFALGKVPLFGLSGKPAAFAAGGFFFFLFFLPTWLFLKDTKTSYDSEHTTLGTTVRASLRDLRELRRYPGAVPYLIAYYLFADAILTLSLFATLYLEVVGELSDMQKNIVVSASVLLGIVGGWMSPLFVRWCGGRKRAVCTFIAVWACFMGLLALAQSWQMFAIVAMLNGFAFSALFALSRAFYSHLIPKEKQATLFSVYVLFERAASILGPLLWSGIAALFASYGADRYRFSMIALALLVLLSLIPFRFVPEVGEREISSEV